MFVSLSLNLVHEPPARLVTFIDSGILPFWPHVWSTHSVIPVPNCLYVTTNCSSHFTPCQRLIPLTNCVGCETHLAQVLAAGVSNLWKPSNHVSKKKPKKQPCFKKNDEIKYGFAS